MSTPNTYTARGLLRHMFHGTYRAAIGLQFDSAQAAHAGLAALGAGWKFHATSADALVWSGDGAALDGCKQRLGTFGADVRKIDSVAKSIDYGEPFTVTIPKGDIST